MTDCFIPAGVTKRFMAQLFAHIMAIGIFWTLRSLVAMALGENGFVGFQMAVGPALMANLASFALALLYSIVLECEGGLTLCKKIMGMRMVQKDGPPP